jgi:hypothetical protein
MIRNLAKPVLRGHCRCHIHIGRSERASADNLAEKPVQNRKCPCVPFRLDLALP